MTKFTKKQKTFNESVFIGVASGLFVYWAQVATEEIMNLFNLEGYVYKLFFSLLLAIFVFIVFVITLKHFSKN